MMTIFLSTLIVIDKSEIIFYNKNTFYWKIFLKIYKQLVSIDFEFDINTLMVPRQFYKVTDEHDFKEVWWKVSAARSSIVNLLNEIETRAFYTLLSHTSHDHADVHTLEDFLVHISRL